MDILIAGDSHIQALGVPIKSSDGAERVEAIEAHGAGVFGVVGGAWPRQGDDYWRATKAAANGRAVAIFWGGNIHLARFLFAPEPLFDFVASDAPDLPLDDAVALVPESAVQVVLAPHVAPIAKILAGARPHAGKVLYCGSPPPKEDDAFLMSRVRHEPYFAQLMKSQQVSFEDLRLSPAPLRLKLWRALQSLMREAAVGAGVEFVPAPASGQTERGFLLPECAALDITHANALYGARVVENLRRHAG